MSVENSKLEILTKTRHALCDLDAAKSAAYDLKDYALVDEIQKVIDLTGDINSKFQKEFEDKANNSLYERYGL